MDRKKESVQKLMQFAGSHKYLTYLSWGLAAVSALIALVPFYDIWCLIREVLKCKGDFSNAQTLVSYGWQAVFFAFLAMVVYLLALMCSHKAAFRVQANMRKQMMDHVMKLPMGYIDEIGTGKIRKIINDSSASTETFIAHQLPDKAVSIATPIGLIGLLLIFNWKLGLICMIPAVIGFLIMGSMMGKEMEAAMKEYQNALEEMSAEAVEYVRGIPVVKTFGQSIYTFKRFKAAIDTYEKWTITYTYKTMKPMIGFTTAINSIFAFLILAAFIFTGNGITDTVILDILFYVIITPIITVTLTKMAYAGEAQMAVWDALARIGELLEKQPLKEPEIPQQPKDGSIEFDHVKFAYEGATKNAIDGISLKVKQGEHVAFVGPSGGGKTTLAALIARFFDVSEGAVKIGGVNVKDIPTEELMRTVSYVFQDSKLLKMSIFENVRIGKKDATREEVAEALKKARCQDIIEKFPQGIDTVIGSKGIYVSGGEAQRISIARAFLVDAPILILDEATAFADPDNEEKVQEAFLNLAKEKTVIMIAHRLSTVTDASKIYVLKDGKIAESGTHTELIQKQGIYDHMWKEYNQSVAWKVGESR